VAAGQSANGLHDHRLKNGRGDILLGYSLVKQRLHIRLGEDTTARRNRINVFMLFSQLIQTLCISVQESSHLINKRSGAAGTDSIHALFQTAGKVDDFGVFATKFHRHICIRVIGTQSLGGSYYFLHETGPYSLRNTDPSRASEAKGQMVMAQKGLQFPKEAENRETHF
jgi:hypothetical protein